MVNNYKDLKVWQVSMDLCTEIYEITKKLPKQEIYGLCSQMRRAAVSISSNIAEGFVRRSPLEFQRFLTISQGSIAELETQIQICSRLKYFKKEESTGLVDRTEILGKMITKLYKSLKR